MITTKTTKTNIKLSGLDLTYLVLESFTNSGILGKKELNKKKINDNTYVNFPKLVLTTKTGEKIICSDLKSIDFVLYPVRQHNV